jgi:hypothetical protein
VEQLAFGQPRPRVVAHVEVGGVASEQGAMRLHRGRVVVNKVRKIGEILVHRAHVVARPVELRAVTLGAADVERDRLPVRSAGRDFEPPLTGRIDLRQRGEIGGQIGGVLVAHLAFDEGGHDAPRLANSADHVGDVQSAAGEIGPEGALSVCAVAVAASRCSGGSPVPVGLAGGGVALLREGNALTQRKHEKPDEESEHDGSPP